MAQGDPAEEALSLLRSGHNAEGLELMDRLIKKNKKQSRYYLLKADACRKLKLGDERMLTLEKALGVKSMDDPASIRLALAEACFDSGLYGRADSLLSGLGRSRDAERLRRNCAAARRLKAEPLDIKIAPLAATAGGGDALWPFINSDGDALLFTRVVGKFSPFYDPMAVQEDIYACQVAPDGSLSEARRPGIRGLRTEDNEGAQCLSADGGILLFVRCGSRSACRIMACERAGEGWSVPYPPRGLENFAWVSCPSLSADGHTLYFAALDRKSRSGRDIYSCSVGRDEGGRLYFYDAAPVRGYVNTPFDELAPFIHPYGERLYFSSDGHPGLGGFDVFYSELQADGSWGRPSNLGFPANSAGDESGFSLNADGSSGYLSTDGYDPASLTKNIYRLDFPVSLRLDAPYEQAGDSFELADILFDIDSSVLRSESAGPLTDFARFLKAHPSYRIIISGHTDDSGTAEHNLALSTARAESVKAFLTSLGIAPERIECIGYGSSRPVGTDRAVNRRIEVGLLRD